MSARFSKLEAVDLADEEDTEAEGGSEDCQVALVLPEGVRKGRKRRIAERLRGKKVGRSLASWRWVLVAVVAFAIAVFVALMVARLANERPSQTGSGNENGQGILSLPLPLLFQWSTVEIFVVVVVMLQVPWQRTLPSAQRCRGRF